MAKSKGGQKSTSDDAHAAEFPEIGNLAIFVYFSYALIIMVRTTF